MPAILCVDIGSTFTKAALVDGATGALVARDAVPTSIGSDVLDGVDRLRSRLDPDADVLACSSAGGGLRLAVVGYERDVTAEAGRRVGLSAGARVVHVSSGTLDGVGVRTLRAASPDIVLLVGGTDGGNGEVLVHNARRLARARLRAPIVVAGNAEAAPAAAATLEESGRSYVVTDNVLPAIGVIRPEPARAAIREVFLRHVIGGKRLSRGPRLARLVQAATPDAVLDGVDVLADVAGCDVIVVDIGGATTDVYSVVAAAGQDAGRAREIVAPLRSARTVEADLGMRWNAEGVLEAADREHLPLSSEARRYAVRVAADPGHLASGADEWDAERQLATVAAMVAMRRHGRPPAPGESPRPLEDVGLVVGSGGVLRHAGARIRRRVLSHVLADHAGGWRVPDRALARVDVDYVLAAAGLLRRVAPDAARGLLRRGLLDGLGAAPEIQWGVVGEAP